jgi:hypothetical protein
MILFPLFSNNGGSDDPEAAFKSVDEQRLEILQLKADAIVAELKDLKKARRSAISSTEKKVIRTKVKELKGDLDAVYAEGQRISGGIYIGSGALIAILILLLLL